MSTEGIKIFNPESSAGIYAALSPAFPKEVLINNETYISPLNYIYGSVLTSPSLRQTVLTSPDALNIRAIFDQLRPLEAMDIARRSFSKGSYEKFKVPMYRRQLLQTGDAELVYRSGNQDFGVNADGVGRNGMGKLLMKIRDMITISEFKDNRDDFFLEFMERLQTLLNVHQAMKTLITNGKEDLTRFIDVHPDSFETLLGSVPQSFSIDATKTLFRNRKVPVEVLMEFSTPGIMVHALIAKYGPSFIKIAEKRIKKQLLIQNLEESIYNTDKEKTVAELKKLNRSDEDINTHMLKKSKEKAREVLSKMPTEIMDDMEARLYILWKANLLRLPFESSFEAVSTVIESSKERFNNALETFKKGRSHQYMGRPGYSVVAFIRDRLVNPDGNVLKDTEFLHHVGVDSRSMDPTTVMSVVEQKRNELLQIIQQKWEQDEDSVVNVSLFESPESPRSIIIFEPLPQDNIPEYRFLSPECTEHSITIDELQFPSVTHYYIACLLAAIVSPTNSVVEVHNRLMDYPGHFMTIPALDKKIHQDIDTLFRNRLIKNAEVALEARFQNDTNLQALLLSTGSKPIFYEDPSDGILGIGPSSKGENVVGKILMKIRTDVAKSGMVKPAALPVPTSTDMKTLLRNNLVLKQWFDMRLKDAVETSKKVASFLRSSLTPSIVDFVVNRLYTNCMSIYDKTVTVVSIPEEFRQSVLTYATPMLPITDSAIAVFWRYMQFLYSSFSQIMLENTTDDATITRKVGEVLAGPVRPLRSDFNCPGVFTSPVRNCAIIAVRSVLDSLNGYFNSPIQRARTPVDARLAALVISIITPNLPLDLKTLSMDNPESLLVARSIPITLPTDVANIFANYVAAIDKSLEGSGLTRDQMITMSRITFFS